MTLDKPAILVDKLPELTSLSSVSGATPLQITSSNAIIPIQCNEIYKQMSSDVIAERENNKQSIGDFVKDHLFKRLKFYHLEFMVYDTRRIVFVKGFVNI